MMKLSEILHSLHGSNIIGQENLKKNKHFKDSWSDSLFLLTVRARAVELESRSTGPLVGIVLTDYM